MINERKDKFKQIIAQVMSDHGLHSKEEFIAAARAEAPELLDDDEACYPGCKNAHPKWRHELDRSIYDMTQTIPKKLRSAGRGSYRPGP